ncbi:MAG: Na-translocating system protein MpsC family protein, partial [Planctomycetota bacterium]
MLPQAHGRVVATSTKGQLEAAISEAVTKFEREFKGRGPSEVRTYIVQDLIVVRLKGVLIPAEEHLLADGDTAAGRELVKHVREALIEKGRPRLESMIAELTGRRVMSLHADISTKANERVIVFTLDGEVEL